MTDRTLVLLRHAKAERPLTGDDQERPLTLRGHDDAATAGAWLARRSLTPDLVLCSPARRSRETWHGVATALGETAGRTETVYEPRLYTASTTQELLDMIVEVDPGMDTVLLVGHNPILSMLSTRLDAASDEGLRTGGIAVHRVEGKWKSVPTRGAALVITHTARAQV